MLTAEDCDDGDAESTVIADDGDCDGVLTADDCDDTDASITGTTPMETATLPATATVTTGTRTGTPREAARSDRDCDGVAGGRHRRRLQVRG